MNRISFIITCLLIAFSTSAQTYNVHMKSGEIIKYNYSEVNFIDFSAGNPSDPSAPAGVEAVDLNLPSGTKWANMNIGASKPEDYGDYFAWGETTPQNNKAYSWSSYKWCNGSQTTLTKYCTDKKYGYNNFTDTKTVLDMEDDAARVNWGGEWRMPTKDEFDELLNNTTYIRTTQNGVYGLKFTSKTNGKSIFLPAAGDCWGGEIHAAGLYGYYWPSSLYRTGPYDAWFLNFDSENVTTYNVTQRNCGLSVRPVR